MPVARADIKRGQRAVTREAQRLALRDGAGTLAVIADTHSNPHPRSVERLEALNPDWILHAGDVGDLSVLTRFERIAPVVAVRGNIDPNKPLPDEQLIELLDERRCVLRILLTHIAVNGPRLRRDAALAAREANAGLVVCGHSHVPFIGSDRKLGVFNPGSIGPRRFQLPIVFGVIDVARDGVRLRHVDCETGQTWTP